MPTGGKEENDRTAVAGARLKLVCLMPPASLDRMVSIHQNCIRDPHQKKLNMELLSDFDIDEAGFREAGGAVVPKW